MRHLLFILSQAPHGFTFIGLFFLAISAVVAFPAIVIGPVKFGTVGLFDYHTLIVGILFGLLGTQLMNYGLILDSHSVHPLRWNRWLLSFNEVFVLKLIIGVSVILVSFLAYIVFTWISHGFNNLHFLRSSLSFLYLTGALGNLGMGVFMAHVVQRS